MPFVAIFSRTSPTPAAIESLRRPFRVPRCRRLRAGLIPIVQVAAEDYALLVPSLTALPVTDLRNVVANLAGDRERILAALDYLFIGF